MISLDYLNFSFYEGLLRGIKIFPENQLSSLVMDLICHKIRKAGKAFRIVFQIRISMI